MVAGRVDLDDATDEGGERALEDRQTVRGQVVRHVFELALQVALAAGEPVRPVAVLLRQNADREAAALLHQLVGAIALVDRDQHQRRFQ